MESKIVSAVGTASSRVDGSTSLSKAIEEAQSQAVLQAMEEGVSLEDSEEILRRKRAAHQAVLAEHRDREAALAAEQQAAFERGE